MVIHPAISSITATDTTITSGKYPIIDIREAETRILMKDGETVVIGGLVKDVKKKENIGIPFLSKIPYLGWLFSRETTANEKVELLIFITAHIVQEGEYTPERITQIETRLGRGPDADKPKSKKKSKNK
jgi:type II secretory pathway component GspD/PulD (secretin)